MSENLRSILGIAQEVKAFFDQKVRKAYPVPMSQFPEFIESFGYIRINKMWTTMLLEDGRDAVKKILELSFKDESINEVMDNIHAGNFSEIIELILDINGIDLKRQDDESKNEKEV